jgi:hypothetical protein
MKQWLYLLAVPVTICGMVIGWLWIAPLVFGDGMVP